MDNSGLGILIAGKIDVEKTVAQINKDLEQITKQIQSLSLNIDTSKITKDIEKQVGNVQKAVDKSVKIDLGNIQKETHGIAASVKQLEKQYNGMIESVVKNVVIAEDKHGKLEERLKNYLVTVRTVDNEIKKIRLSPFEDEQGKTVLKPTDIQTVSKANQEREKALRYEQQTRKAIEKTLETSRKKTEELEHQIKLAQQQARINVQNLRRRYGTVLTAEQNQQLEAYINSMDRLSTSTPNARREIQNLNMAFKQVQADVATAGSHVNTFAENLREALARIPVWMIGMTAFYAPLRGMRQAVDNVIMLDSQMTELRRVMDAAPETYNRLMRESIELSSELGNRVEDVNNAMIEFARQGYDPDTLVHLTETATIASNISELDTTEAMSSLTAAMMSFNIEAENSIEILDRINEVNIICLPA